MIVAILLATQMPWTAGLPQHGASLDLLRPKFEGGGTSLTSFAVFASARMPLGGSTLRVELPFARLSTTSGTSSSSFGNPYIGLEFGGDKRVSYEVGMRGPLASETEIAPQLGALSDVTRFEAFFPNLAAFTARARYRFRDATGFTFEAGGGPSVWFSTQGGGDPEVVLHHHMMAGYRGPDMWFAAGFGGFTAVTGDGGSVGDRTLHQVGASVGFAGGRTRPAFHVLVPLQSGFFSSTQIVLGIGLAIAAN